MLRPLVRLTSAAVEMRGLGTLTELADWAHRDARAIKPREVIELLDAIVDRPAPRHPPRQRRRGHQASEAHGYRDPVDSPDRGQAIGTHRSSLVRVGSRGQGVGLLWR